MAIAHEGQRFAFGMVFTGRYHERRRRVAIPRHHVIEQRWLDLLDSHYVPHPNLGPGRGRAVWRNGHQKRWYYRWAMNGSGQTELPPKPRHFLAPAVPPIVTEAYSPMLLAA